MSAPRAFHRNVTLRTGLVTVVAAVLMHFGLGGGTSHPGHAFAGGYSVYSIPSGSMAPTLQINDYVMAFERDKVARGDVVVYLLPKDGSTVYIKRVVGLPGDRIQMIDGVLHINNQPVKRERIEDYVTADNWGRSVPVIRYRETLPNGVSHEIIEREGDTGTFDNTLGAVMHPRRRMGGGEDFDMGDAAARPVVEVQTGAQVVDQLAGAVGGRPRGAAPGRAGNHRGPKVIDRHSASRSSQGFKGECNIPFAHTNAQRLYKWALRVLQPSCSGASLATIGRTRIAEWRAASTSRLPKLRPA